MQILRTSAVAEKIGVHPRTIWRWARNPAMNFPKPISVSAGVTGFICEDVDKWLAERAARSGVAPEGRAA